MSGIEIVLSVVVLTCVFIFAGLVLVYLSSKNKRGKETTQEVSVEEPKLNISEPVLSFIQEVKNNPKRFDLKQVADIEEEYPIIKSAIHTEEFYQLKDKDTLEVWDVSIKYYSHSHYMFRSRTYKFPTWLTYDECKQIHSTFYEIYEARKEKIKQRELERKERNDQQERERLKQVYCNK